MVFMTAGHVLISSEGSKWLTKMFLYLKKSEAQAIHTMCEILWRDARKSNYEPLYIIFLLLHISCTCYSHHQGDTLHTHAQCVVGRRTVICTLTSCRAVSCCIVLCRIRTTLRGDKRHERSKI